MNRLRQKYTETVAPALQQQFGYTNVHQIPAVSKVVINAGVGRATADAKHLETAVASLRKISGQTPIQTVAKHSIAAFKLREGNKIGSSVTLRGERMYEFLDRLVAVALPRIRDFRGISPEAFDPQGNFSLGIKEQGIFPEIPYEEATNTHGLQINIITTAKTKAEGRKLLELMGFPFKRSTS
ncbi:50S ribosomal protein L5 [Candidatus Parcubacteria bacterium]|nr:50S ribosomal protein L5 [Candidatus Parcubacteria bacterium]